MKALLLFPTLLLAQQPDARELLLHSGDALKKSPSYQIQSLSVLETLGGVVNSMQLTTTISVRRPDLMRIESKNGPLGITVVSDGLHTYIYFDQQKKFIKRAATSLPESALGETGILKDLPDINSAMESAEITGEKTMEIDDKSYECWVVEARYKTIDLPDRQMTIQNAAQVSWISKTMGLTLQNSFKAELIVGSMREPVEMSQATTTVALSLNSDLPNSLFTFQAPAGAVETADWTLPGITKPDVEGKPAPAINGALPANGKVVLINFCTAWSKPCGRQAPLLEKLRKEYAPKGLAVVNANIEDPANAEALKTLSVNAFPTLVLVDRTGKVALYEVGAKSEAALRSTLAKQGIAAVSK